LLSVDGKLFHTWQEAEEREIPLAAMTLGEPQARPHDHVFTLPGRRWTELIHGSSGEDVGALVRTQREIKGHVVVRATAVAAGLFRLTVRVEPRTSAVGKGWTGRDDALLSSLVSAHTLLSVHAGEFVSLLDPPEDCREAAAACRNIGVWPVLVGNDGQTDTLLASPIILYDYPQVAPESPGDFFDGTEIDEMLTLRILTLTDDEKRVMAAVDERARALLERTQTRAWLQLPDLHGTIRGLRAVGEGGKHG
jgi:hydrogenase maturation protease